MEMNKKENIVSVSHFVVYACDGVPLFNVSAHIYAFSFLFWMVLSFFLSPLAVCIVVAVFIMQWNYITQKSEEKKTEYNSIDDLNS